MRRDSGVEVPETNELSTTSVLEGQAEKVLAMPQHKPADIDLFPSMYFYSGVQLTLRTEGTYPRGSAMSPAPPGPKPTLSQVKSQLTSFLKERFGSNQSEINTALATFSSSKAKSLIPDYRLRAAFAALTGTSLQPAIDYYLNNTDFFSLGPIAFGSLLSLTAISEADHSGGHAQILISARYENEPWQLFVALLGHELQHSQSQVTLADEAITNFELYIEYAEILAKHPKLAYRDTELTRRLNGDVQALLDARHPGSARNVIVAADGLGLFPGSDNMAKDIWSDYTGTTGGGISSAPPEAKTVLSSLLPGIHLPKPLNYDESTAKLFEHLNDTYLPPTTRLRLAVLLQLVTVTQIAHKLGITGAQAISKFKLQPTLKIVHAGQYSP
ncbi:MAG TPA: hypothetical protein VID47_06740 [Actinomycetota bacterium]